MYTYVYTYLKVYYNDRQTVIPMHSKKEVKPGTLRAIFRQLGLEKLK
jgi:predicted RNA binding protein YcfA (HicA-like mRNA interferase family)